MKEEKMRGYEVGREIRRVRKGREESELGLKKERTGEGMN